MKSYSVCSRITSLGETALSFLSDTFRSGSAGVTAIYAAIAAWIGSLVISEATILKTFFVSVGVLIGVTFSDFLKKHRWLLVFVMLGSATLFLYKVLASMEEDDEF